MPRLEEIETRLAAATPGPWHVEPDRTYPAIARIPPTPGEWYRIASIGSASVRPEREQTDRANAALIAAAPSDLAWLVAEVRRLQGLLEQDENGTTKLEAILYESGQLIVENRELERDLDRRIRECDRLREALRDLTLDWERWDWQHDEPEDAEVAILCERHGYGAVMDAASRLWARRDANGSFVVGTCRLFARRARAALAEGGT